MPLREGSAPLRCLSIVHERKDCCRNIEVPGRIKVLRDAVHRERQMLYTALQIRF